MVRANGTGLYRLSVSSAVLTNDQPSSKPASMADITSDAVTPAAKMFRARIKSPSGDRLSKVRTPLASHSIGEGFIGMPKLLTFLT